jgi:hypothetical protein
MPDQVCLFGFLALSKIRQGDQGFPLFGGNVLTLIMVTTPIKVFARGLDM